MTLVETTIRYNADEVEVAKLANILARDTIPSYTNITVTAEEYISFSHVLSEITNKREIKNKG